MRPGPVGTHASYLLLLSAISCLIIPSASLAQVTVQWIQIEPGTFQRFYFDEISQLARLDLVNGSTIRLHHYNLSGDRVASIEVPDANMEGFTLYETDYIGWSGQREPDDVRAFDIVVSRLTGDGAVLWSKTFDLGWSPRLYNAISDSDGNILLLGYEQVRTGQGTAHVIKLGSDGQLHWDNSDFFVYSTVSSIVELPDKTLLAFGTVSEYGSGEVDYERQCPFVAKINEAGTQISHTCLLEEARGHGFLGQTRLSDGSFAFAVGPRYELETMFKIVRVSSFGEVLSISEPIAWNGSSPNELKFAMAEAVDGGFWLAGEHGEIQDQNTLLMRLDDQSGLMWEMSVELIEEPGAERARGILPLSERELLISGSASLIDVSTQKWVSQAFVSSITVAEGTSAEREGRLIKPELEIYPNPALRTAAIRFTLTEPSVVTASIYDILGRKVKALLQNQFYLAGPHRLQWNGENAVGIPLPSGMYFFVVEHATGRGAATLSLIN